MLVFLTGKNALFFWHTSPLAGEKWLITQPVYADVCAYFKHTRWCVVANLYIEYAQAELEMQREEEKRKMEERSDQLNASQKEALLEKFKLDQVTFLVFHVGVILTMLCKHFYWLFLHAGFKRSSSIQTT